MASHFPNDIGTIATGAMVLLPLPSVPFGHHGFLFREVLITETEQPGQRNSCRPGDIRLQPLLLLLCDTEMIFSSLSFSPPLAE